MKNIIMKCALAAALSLGSVSVFTEALKAKSFSYHEEKKDKGIDELKELEKAKAEVNNEIAKVEKQLRQGKLTKQQAEKKVIELEKAMAEIAKAQAKLFDNLNDYEISAEELKKLAHEIDKKEDAAEQR